MDTDIKKSNKIPGCEQLTRPEEIAALSKYLGEIKRVQEEHTKLGKDSLEVPGMSFGRENPNDPTELVNSVVGIDDKREGKLETTRISVSGKVQNVELEEGLEKLEDNRESTLNAKTENLGVKEENKLGDQKVGLKTNPENTNLGTHTEKIEDTREEKLSDKVEGLSDPREIKLGNKRSKLEDQRQGALETKKENLEDFRKTTLSDTKENLKDTREELSLGDKTEHLNSDPGVKELGNKRSKLEDDRKINLSEKTENLEDPRENTLSSFTDSLDASQDNTLSNTVSVLDDTRPQQNLGDYILGIENEAEVEELVDSVISPSQSPEDVDTLEDHRENINPSQPEDLREERRDIMGNEDVESLVPSPTYSDYLKKIIREANERRDENGLYNTAIRLFSEQDSEWAQRVSALMSAYLSGSRISPERAEEFENILAQSFIYPNSQLPNQSIRPDNTSGNVEDESDFERHQDRVRRDGENVNPDLSESRVERPDNTETRNTDDSYLDPELAIENKYLLQRPDNQEFRESINGISISSHTFENPEDLVQRKEGIIRTPDYDLKINPWVNFGIASLNKGGVSNYLRYTAEQTIGSWARGSLRTQLINEALALLVRSRDQLEKVSKINKDRLPGDDSELLSGLAKAVDGGLGSALGKYGFTGYDPKAGVQGLVKSGINVAKNMAGRIFDRSEVPAEPFNRPRKDEELGKVSVSFDTNLGSSYTMEPSMFKVPIGWGMIRTLSDLCDIPANEVSQIGSVEELYDILNNSELITTAGKINKDTRRTLDSNMYWEVLISPWVNTNTRASNGGYSFLPSIKEINTVNLVDSGVITSYNNWIPVSGFELQKSKLTTKSLGLFDGEINYPVTSEYTNELRITIVDDQWKSWKHYFQKCSDVSVYNSEPHERDYYKLTSPVPTAVDKSTMCAAFYKNITFKISVYVMNPQYSTLKKFSLLCVLKDFSEDYTGEVDSGGSDLSVSFSIVGELSQDMDELDSLSDILSDVSFQRPDTSNLKILPEPLKIDPPKTPRIEIGKIKNMGVIPEDPIVK